MPRSTPRDAGRLVVIAGPSCAGKTPLLHALQRHDPQRMSRMQSVVLYNDRAPRPGEVDGVDYHFRKRDTIEAMRSDDRCVVMDVRGDLQALDLDTLDEQLQRGDTLFEGNPYVAAAMLDHPRLRDAPRLAIFVSPIDAEELRAMRRDPRIDAQATVTEVMRRKLLRRGRQLKGELSRRDLDEVERRAGRAYHELSFAPRFDAVVPNHDGEDSENWDTFPLPLGDARRTMRAVAALLAGEPASGAETWSASLLEDEADGDTAGGGESEGG